MNNYVWKIKNLEYAISADGKSNVVNNISWGLTGSNGSFSITTNGSQDIAFNPNASFINYSDLTENIIIGWLEASMGANEINKIKQFIDAQIQLHIDTKNILQINPTTGSGLPWSN